MIHAFNFTCHRDWNLSELMVKTLNKYCPVEVKINVINTDTDPKYCRYGNGAGWEAGMMKIDYMKTMSFADDDWVLSVDSDVIFTNGKVFDLLDLIYGILGIMGQQPWDTLYGKWAHMSGCLIFMRGDIAREICSWSDDAFNRIRYEQFKSYGITENEDVMLSYFAMLASAIEKDIGQIPGITSGNFEQDIVNCGSIEDIGFREMASFYHLNYCPTQFLGETVSGKWDIPAVLKKKGIVI